MEKVYNRIIIACGKRMMSMDILVKYQHQHQPNHTAGTLKKKTPSHVPEPANIQILP
jgi:hypothetical protein